MLAVSLDDFTCRVKQSDVAQGSTETPIRSGDFRHDRQKLQSCSRAFPAAKMPIIKGLSPQWQGSNLLGASAVKAQVPVEGQTGRSLATQSQTLVVRSLADE